MRKVVVNGKEYKAYSLLMRKENALDILHGKKRVELRSASPFYEKMFIDEEQAKRNEDDPDNYEPPLRGDVVVVHFYSTGSDWTLDVFIDNIGLAYLSKELVEELNEEYDFHELDDEWQKYEGRSDEDVPQFFWLGIDEIIQHSGLE